MAAPKRRSAMAFYWSSPLGESCALIPESSGGGLLEVEVLGDLVSIHSRNCLLKISNGKVVKSHLAEYEFSTSLQRCQITWAISKRKEGEVVERSVHFRQ